MLILTAAAAHGLDEVPIYSRILISISHKIHGRHRPKNYVGLRNCSLSCFRTFFFVLAFIMVFDVVLLLFDVLLLSLLELVLNLVHSVTWAAGKYFPWTFVRMLFHVVFVVIPKYAKLFSEALELLMKVFE